MNAIKAVLTRDINEPGINLRAGSLLVVDTKELIAMDVSSGVHFDIEKSEFAMFN